MENLATKISEIKGIGPKTADKFELAGIDTIRDLFFFFPRKYDDYTKITAIDELGGELKAKSLKFKEESSKLTAGELFTVRGTVLAIANKKTRRRGFTVTEAQIVDNTGSLKVVWFNQPYLAKMLKDRVVILNGKVSFDRFSNSYVMESPTRANIPKIMPIYFEMRGLSSYFFQKLIQKFSPLTQEIDEYLPKSILSDHKLPDIRQALIQIHNPKNSNELELARRRFAFEELFLISLNANLANEEIKSFAAEPIEADIESLKSQIALLPFMLTNDQKKALWQILEDLKKKIPMNRLLNGDVGSGKTVVAALAAAVANKAGFKTVVMCPTSILANQHYETFRKLLKNSGLSIGLITSDAKIIDHLPLPITHLNKQMVNIQINDQCKMKNDKSDLADCQILIGTHALLYAKEPIENIGLVVVDEQHRFGVKQRAAIAEISNFKFPPKGSLWLNQNSNDKCEMENEKYQKVRPHFLSMTATPIPRTLNLALFGNLDLSVIKEKPADRKEIKTKLVEENNRQKAYDFIGKQIQTGRQAFIICPLIESSHVILSPEGDPLGQSEESHNNEEILRFTQDDIFSEEKKTVVDEFQKLQKIYPKFKIGMLHGKMKPKEKEEIMADFVAGKINLLVSTSVVEVGVDVPNASVMMIEDADRFGLAQIHQFRGRVGRGEHQSFCFLFSNSFSQKSIDRLRALENTSDGFELAEIDLEQRGPGAIFGTEQSGILDLKWASLSDRVLMEEASHAAKSILPELEKYPKLKLKSLEFSESNHFE
jgi:ATP-dependent DNA helicase RecG